MDLKLKHFKIEFTRNKLLFGCYFSCISFFACLMWGTLKAAIFFVVLLLIVSSIRIRTDKTVFSISVNILYLVFLFVACFVFHFYLLEQSPYIKPIHIEGSKYFINILVCFAAFSIILFIVSNWRLAAIITTFIILLFSTINGYVFHFRGNEFLLIDILSAQTAINVGDQYIIELSRWIIYPWLFWLVACFFLFVLPDWPESNKLYHCAASAIFMLISCSVLTYCAKDINMHLWRSEGTYYNGYYLNLYLGLKNSFISKPDEYSSDAINGLESEYRTVFSNSNNELPNILVVMCESYCDLNVIGPNLKTNIPFMEYYNSMNDNTIKGYALTSVFGGNTSNAEFEFLTGNTMGFLPDGTVAYQQFIKHNVFSIPAYLESLGYKSISTHPYYANGWSRDVVYPLLGFSESHFLPAYSQDFLVRNLVGDKEVYSNILESVKSEDDPMFIFGITMQNHGGYVYTGDDFESSVQLTDSKANYPMAEQYMSLIHYSDRALEYFISELESIEEKTIVLFFGDHFPKLDEDFLEYVHGGEFNSLEEQMLKYKVPFTIWANYDLEEREIDCTSLNYLGRYLLEAADITLPPYFAFLSDMEKNIPAINAFGYYSMSKNSFIKFEQAEYEEKIWLNKYAILQYNCLFDTKRNSDIFLIPPTDILR